MKTGDTVRLNPLSRWNKGNVSNPVDTDGIIMKFNTNIPFGVDVLWDNEELNSYNQIDLVLVKSCDVIIESCPEPVVDSLIEELNVLVQKYKSVLVGCEDENSGVIFVRMSDGMWTRMNHKGEQDGLYISNRDICTEKRKKTVTALDTKNEIHISLIRTVLKEDVVV